jgi:four helix bundle protein
MSDFKKLLVWQKSHALSLAIYSLAGGIRGSLHASLRSQMVRAAMSIPANIVEGSGQRSRKEFGRFVRISLNSSSELEHHLISARDLKLVTTKVFETRVAQTIEIRKMLCGLLRYLEEENG